MRKDKKIWIYQMFLETYLGKTELLSPNLRIKLIKNKSRNDQMKLKERIGPAVCPICFKSDRVICKGFGDSLQRNARNPNYINEINRQNQNGGEQKYFCKRDKHKFVNTPFAGTRSPEWAVNMVLGLAVLGNRLIEIARFVNCMADYNKDPFRISRKGVRGILKRCIKIIQDYELRATGNWEKLTWQIDDSPQWLSIIKEHSPLSEDIAYDRIKPIPTEKMKLPKLNAMLKAEKENAAQCPYCSHCLTADEEVLGRYRKELLFIKCTSCEKIYYLKLRQQAWITSVVAEEHCYVLARVTADDRKAVNSELAVRRALKVTKALPVKIKMDGYRGHPAGVRKVLRIVVIEAIPKPKKGRNYKLTNLSESKQRRSLRDLGVPKRRTYRSSETMMFAAELSRISDNFFRTHEFLDENRKPLYKKTPAQKAGIVYPYHKHLSWSEFIRFAFTSRKENKYDSSTEDEKPQNALESTGVMDYYNLIRNRQIVPNNGLRYSLKIKGPTGFSGNFLGLMDYRKKTRGQTSPI
jgi:hypothetical protein